MHIDYPAKPDGIIALTTVGGLVIHVLFRDLDDDENRIDLPYFHKNNVGSEFWGWKDCKYSHLKSLGEVTVIWY